MESGGHTFKKGRVTGAFGPGSKLSKIFNKLLKSNPGLCLDVIRFHLHYDQLRAAPNIVHTIDFASGFHRGKIAKTPNRPSATPMNSGTNFNKAV